MTESLISQGLSADGCPLDHIASFEPPAGEPTAHDSATSMGYSLFSGMSNMLLAVLGAGQLTLPYALSQLGWAGGLVGLLVFALLGTHSLTVLATHAIGCCSQQSSSSLLQRQSSVNDDACRTLSCGSYAELAISAFGSRAKIVCDFLLAAYAWGGAVSFFVILKSELSYLATRITGFSENAIPQAPLLILWATVVIWPLGARQDPGALRRFTPLGCIAAVSITVLVLVLAPWDVRSTSFFGLLDACSGPHGGSDVGPLPGEGLRRWPESFWSAAAALPLLSFALNSSWAFIPILAGLRMKTMRRAFAMIYGGSLAIAFDYATLAIVGYSTFCGAADSNILQSLGKNCGGVQNAGLQCSLVLVARAALAIQLTLALPLRFFVARSVIAGQRPESCTKRWSVSFVLVLSAASLAGTGLPLSVAIGVTSSICASLIIYIMPSLIDLKLSPKQSSGKLRRLVSLLSLPIGFFVLLAGTIANLTGASQGS
eukprot:TRINITY_DN11791_c0_g2_i1.p1 TRINITY_DN11791_c0_g2~~TRINITY_DN11791_c0_g2_i1.p1  ORF type:complete len:486 (+),score=30.16 TRINITY_DN11791_c0_g2_i1:69-1526(+)